MSQDPHAGRPIERAGSPLAEAEAAIVLVHGRGATARSILDLGTALDLPATALLAPQAHSNTWYPNSFLAPVDSNEPGRTSGLSAIARTIQTATEAGFDLDRIVIIGFSQGGCLASEYVARTPQRYGGLAVLSGGLIGPEIDIDSYSGALDGMPVFLGCSDRDPHIPATRVEETAAVFERLDGEVSMRLYPGMGHGVNEDELSHIRTIVSPLVE